MQDAIQYIRTRVNRVPKLALILGSGLGSLAESALNAIVLPTADIPDYPRSTVEGHSGKLIFGELEGSDVVFLQGRVHFYEGHNIRNVTFPIRLLHALGITHLVVTNAAGGINDTFRPGTIMFIHDHINMTGQNPLIGPNGDGGPRFPDMSNPYDSDWLRKAEHAALKRGIATRKGVYIGVLGPSYETKAEIKFFRTIGADAVGMSTVPEVIQAAYFGMKVLGISTITNMASGMQGPLNHQEVMDMGIAMRSDLETLVKGIVQETL
ncbi:MAG TPA: purine-nucleoside phosphorylase [Bacteroidetes bacterium]|nr:purine-nucleoside phosphorylase [Bacteroidota bacterium]HRR08251.1 purine-nucleoside phosphorylase [Rhodothermales bacterium]